MQGEKKITMVYENNHNASQKQVLRTKLNSLAHVGCHLFNNSEIKSGSAKGYVLGYVQFSLPFMVLRVVLYLTSCLTCGLAIFL